MSEEILFNTLNTNSASSISFAEVLGNATDNTSLKNTLIDKQNTNITISSGLTTVEDAINDLDTRTSGKTTIKLVDELPIPPENNTQYWSKKNKDTGEEAVDKRFIYMVDADGNIAELGTSGASVTGVIYKKDIVDDTATPASDMVLSANQGYILNKTKVSSTNIEGCDIQAYTKEEFDALTTKSDSTLYLVEDDTGVVDIVKNVYNIIYPVNSIFMGFQAPGAPAGVIWTDISSEYDGKYFKVDSTKDAGTATAESITVEGTAITTAQMPKHSHTRGSMRIQGWSSYMTIDRGAGSSAGGVMYANNNDYDGPAGTGGGRYTVGIDTNREDGKWWTGSTSEIGSGQKHTHTANNICPAATTIKVWKRTA